MTGADDPPCMQIYKCIYDNPNHYPQIGHDEGPWYKMADASKGCTYCKKYHEPGSPLGSPPGDGYCTVTSQHGPCGQYLKNGQPNYCKPGIDYVPLNAGCDDYLDEFGCDAAQLLNGVGLNGTLQDQCYFHVDGPTSGKCVPWS